MKLAERFRAMNKLMERNPGRAALRIRNPEPVAAHLHCIDTEIIGITRERNSTRCISWHSGIRSSTQCVRRHGPFVVTSCLSPHLLFSACAAAWAAAISQGESVAVSLPTLCPGHEPPRLSRRFRIGLPIGITLAHRCFHVAFQPADFHFTAPDVVDYTVCQSESRAAPIDGCLAGNRCCPAWSKAEHLD